MSFSFYHSIIIATIMTIRLLKILLVVICLLIYCLSSCKGPLRAASWVGGLQSLIPDPTWHHSSFVDTIHVAGYLFARTLF